MTKKPFDLLKAINTALNADPNGYIFTLKREHKELVEAGHVSVDGTCHDGGIGFMRKYATRITEEGINFLEKELGYVIKNNDIEPVKTTIIEKGANMTETQFAFEPIVKATRNRSTRTSAYPFDTMPEPNAEGLCATWYSEVGADVVKKVQSAVGATNRKWSEESGEVKISKKTGNEIPVLRAVRKYSVTILYVPAEAEEFAGEPYAKVQRVM